MPAIKASTNNATDYFNLDGLDYEKGAYVFYYDSVETAAGVIAKTKIRIGLKSKSELQVTLIKPSLVTDWTNGSTAYSDFDTFIAAASILISA